MTWRFRFPHATLDAYQRFGRREAVDYASRWAVWDDEQRSQTFIFPERADAQAWLQKLIDDRKRWLRENDPVTRLHDRDGYQRKMLL